MASVEFEHVTKRFDDTTAIDDLSLNILDEEFVVLVGPSGCGKTTALRLLAGLEELTSGRILIGDQVVNDLSPKDRDIAMVFQNYCLYPHMSVFNNMAFSLQLKRYPKEEIRRRVHEAADILSIRDLLSRKPKGLSGGESQRVAIGRAIVREPRAFLFDEPLSNLDAQSRLQMRAEIIKLQRRLRATFVYVTHDQVEAMCMATRVAVLNKGKLQQFDTPQNLYAKPDNLFVAGFIGSPPMNFFPAKLIGVGDQLKVDSGDFSLSLPSCYAAGCKPYTNQDIILGLRPEHIHEAAFQPAGVLAGHVSADVEVAELMGNEVILYLRSGRHIFTARVDAPSRLKAGQHMQVVFDMNHLHFFDPRNEKAIGEMNR